MKLAYHRLAAVEIEEAARFYESKSPGLGERFLEQIDESVATLLRNPERWPLVGEDIRRVLLKRFPFGIYYRVSATELRVPTLKHHKRHPGYAMGRK